MLQWSIVTHAQARCDKNTEAFLNRDLRSRELQEAQSSTKGYKPMLKTRWFCTFLIDLHHEDPVLKIEVINTISYFCDFCMNWEMP